MNKSSSRIAENFERIRENIARAAEESGRSASNVTLVAVTKYAGVEEARQLLDAGCRDLGESRPQQLWEKAAALAGEDVRWHQIGHMQRNKLRRTVPLLACLQSADSTRLLAAADEEAARMERTLPVLIEVNVSRDPSKHGFAPEEVEPLLAELPSWPHLEVRGLMCMASLEGDLDTAARNFADLRELRDRLQPQCPPGVSLAELSMGMSRDYEAAIREGSTIVRIGSALFE